MGTSFAIKFIRSDDHPIDAERVESTVRAELDEVNAQMSTYISSSEISKFNSSPSTDWTSVSVETAQVVQLALEISKETDGAFDCTVGPLVDLWGFGPQGRRAAAPTEKDIQETLDRCGYANLSVRLSPPAIRKQIPRLRIDLSAIAKGHGVDRVCGVLKELGIASYYVEIGGEVRAAGVKGPELPWRVGISRPVEGEYEMQTAVDISDLAMATSGNYQNYYNVDGQKLWHTLDPRTGRPAVSKVLSASIIADSCARADALATAAMVMGKDLAIQTADKSAWDVLLILPPADASSEMTIIQSSEFPNPPSK